MAQNKQTLEEVKALASNESSCIKTREGDIVILLHPMYAGNVKQGINMELTAMSSHYSKELGGIPMAYEKVRVSPDGGLFHTNPFIHFRIQATFYVFSPEIGSKLEGFVQKKSPNHLGCLVHKMFNVSVSRPFTNSSSQEWKGESLEEGDAVKLIITDVNMSFYLPMITGELDESYVIKKSEPSTSMDVEEEDEEKPRMIGEDSGISSESEEKDEKKKHKSSKEMEDGEKVKKKKKKEKKDKKNKEEDVVDTKKKKKDKDNDKKSKKEKKKKKEKKRGKESEEETARKEKKREKKEKKRAKEKKDADEKNRENSIAKVKKEKNAKQHNFDQENASFVGIKEAIKMERKTNEMNVESEMLVGSSANRSTALINVPAEELGDFDDDAFTAKRTSTKKKIEKHIEKSPKGSDFLVKIKVEGSDDTDARMSTSPSKDSTKSKKRKLDFGTHASKKKIKIEN